MEAGGASGPGKKLPRWDKFDSQRFVALIGDGAINPTQTTKEYIERIRRQYWPQRDYRNFSANYRRTCQKWLVHRDQRECCCLVFFCSAKSKQTRRASIFEQAYLGNTRGGTEGEDEGVDFDNEEELGLSNEAEEAGDAEGGFDGMPSGRGSAGRGLPNIGRLQVGAPAGRPAPPPLPAAPLVSVGLTYPYLVKTFVYDHEEYTVVELYTNGRPVTAFRCWVPQTQNGLNVATMLPGWFFESNRMVREMNGAGGNESYVQAHDDIVQIARGMFGHTGPLSPPQFIPLRNKIRRDFMEIQRLDFDGKEEVLRNGANYGPVRTFEHVLRITLKTTREMLQKPAEASTQYFGDPDEEWVRGGYPARRAGDGGGDGSGGF